VPGLDFRVAPWSRRDFRVAPGSRLGGQADSVPSSGGPQPVPAAPGRRVAGHAIGRAFGPAIALLACVLVALPAAAATPSWSTPRRIALGSRVTSLHELAAGTAALHLVTARIGPGKRDDAVLYRRSTDGGVTWARPRAIWSAGRTWRSVVPNLAIAASGRLVVAAWRVRGRPGSALFVAVSRDSGATWRAPLKVAGSGRGPGLGVPGVTVATGAVVVAWTDHASGAIRVRRSTDAGATFRPATRIASTGMSVSCANPRMTDGLVGLASADARVYLAWSDARRGRCIADRVRLRASADGGATWTKPVTVTARDSYGWPEVAARQDRVLVSVQRADGALVLSRSRDRGRTFSDRLLDPPRHHYLGAGDIALMPGGRAWLVVPELVVEAGRLSWSRLLFRQSSDGGTTWGAAETIAPRARLLRQAPNVAAWSGRPVVVYQSGAPDGAGTGVWFARRR
jgi:hypothetical protein